MASSQAGAKQRLLSEYKSLQKEKWVNIEVRGLGALQSVVASH